MFMLKEMGFDCACLHQGVAVTLTEEEERKARGTITQYGFNMVVSDKISMDRRIKDTRPAE